MREDGTPGGYLPRRNGPGAQGCQERFPFSSDRRSTRISGRETRPRRRFFRGKLKDGFRRNRRTAFDKSHFVVNPDGSTFQEIHDLDEVDSDAVDEVFFIMTENGHLYPLGYGQ